MGYTLRKKYKNPEGQLQLSIIKYCKIKGYTVGKTKTTGIFRKGKYFSDPHLFLGFPDLTVFTPTLVFVEVKSSKGVMSASQKNFQELCKKANIKYIVAKKLEDVIQSI